MGLRRIALGVVCLAVTSVSPANAQGKKKAPPAPAPQPAPPSDDSPWSKGVSAEAKASAQRLLGEGNQLFIQKSFKEALAKYDEAVAVWDHPGIRFNMVRALIALDRPLEAMENLERALAYGEAPFEEQMYSEGLNYQRLLAAQLGELEVSCKQSGVLVKLDGTKLLDCPGHAARRVVPGAHVVVGSKDGFLTHTQDLMLIGGKHKPIEIELKTIEHATTYKRRWDAWRPWAVAGSGLVFGGLGLLVVLEGRADMRELGDALASCGPLGCSKEEYAEEFQPREDIARLENRIGITMIAAGATVAIAGLVGVVLNRPEPYLDERRNTTARVVPHASGDGGSLVITGGF